MQELILHKLYDTDEHNNVTLTFLWIAKLDSSFPFSSPSIVLNEFIKVFLMKATGCWHRPPTSLFITPISFFPVCHPYIFWPSNAHCSHQHSYHAKQLALSSEFNWRDSLHSAVNSIGETPLAVKYATTACSLKGTDQCSVEASGFMHNSNTTSNNWGERTDAIEHVPTCSASLLPTAGKL